MKVYELICYTDMREPTFCLKIFSVIIQPPLGVPTINRENDKRNRRYRNVDQ